MAGTVGKRESDLSFGCPIDYKEGRAVTIDDGAGTVVYTTAGAVPDALTVGPTNDVARSSLSSEFPYTISVKKISGIFGSEFVTPAAAISRGDDLEVIGTLGKVQPQSGGTSIGMIAQGDAASTDGLVAAYRKA